MDDEADQVGDDEAILRRIPNRDNFVSIELPIAVMRLAFRPNDSDGKGLSVFRAEFSSAEDLAAAANDPNNCYVASMLANRIRALELSLVADENPKTLSGHTLIPEINVATRKSTKAQQLELAKLASENIVFSPHADD